MQLFFYPIADSFLLVALIALGLTGLLALGAGRGKLGAGQRWGLAAIRAVVILLVTLAMLRPTLVYTEIKKEKATLVGLVDQTRSMSVRDGLSGKSRWQSLREALAQAAPALRELARDFELKAYTFDSTIHPAETSGGKIALAETPEGRETAIGAALEDVLRQEAGKRLLGVVVLSDGAQRAVAPHDLPPSAAAAQLKHDGAPLFAVVFGQSRSLGGAQDVAATELLATDTVFVNNELNVTGQIRVDGFVNRELPVRLLFETKPGQMEVVAQENIKATADGQLVPVKFTYVPQDPGEFKLMLEAVPQAGELVTTNNQLTTLVNVLPGGLRVLYIEGALRYEQKYLRWALDASRDMKVDYVRLDPRQPETRHTKLAAELPDSLQPGKYEVYILGDVDSTAFRESELKGLAEAVRRGAGLIMLGGFHTFGPGGYNNTPLAEVLPVVMDRLERQRLDDPDRSDLHLPGPLRMTPTPQGLRHFALLLAATPQESAALWKRLPQLEGANHFVKLGPRAVVLADADGDERKPLLVADTIGAGRVLAFAADSTWHWWMRGFETAHKRFWRQIVLWLARKDQAGAGKLWVNLDKRRFMPGERVDFRAGALSKDGEPLVDADFKAQVVIPPEGARRSAVMVRQSDDWSGSFRDTQTAGDYSIEVAVTERGAPLGTRTARFSVSPQDLELDNASADPDGMEILAKETGGKSVAPEQLGELIQQVARQTQDLETPQTTKRTLWDRWAFFLTLVGLLSVEWYLRKRWGLV
jgi:uncharacterized membrane protein